MAEQIAIGGIMNGGKTGAKSREREPQDFYPTPDNVTQALLNHWTPPREIWEPAAGDGSMAKVLERAGHKVISTELMDRGYGETGVDFLQTTERRADCIITNPPYEVADKFIIKAHRLGGHYQFCEGEQAESR